MKRPNYKGAAAAKGKRGNYNRSRPRSKPNPTGRVDILAFNFMEALVKQYVPTALPVLQEFTPEIKTELAKRLGPRNPKMRTVRDVVKRMAQARAQRPPRGVTGHVFVEPVGGGPCR